jgi:hypothetical protein
VKVEDSGHRHNILRNTEKERFCLFYHTKDDTQDLKEKGYNGGELMKLGSVMVPETGPLIPGCPC